MTQPAERPLRLCDSCAALDDHPRHVIGVSQGDNTPSAEFVQQALAAADAQNHALVVSELLDTSTTMKHMDCCATDGCPDGSCDLVVSMAQGAKGPDLVALLTEGNA